MENVLGMGQKLIPAAHPQVLTTMDIKYSRFYLRAIPEQLRNQRKEEMKRNFLNKLVSNVTNAASHEKTSYMVEEAIYAEYQPSMQRGGAYYPCQNVSLTDQEIIATLKEKFPDCGVSFQETWVDTARNTRTLKKGILIDWS